MKVEPPIYELQNVVRGTFAYGEQSRRQGGLEAEGDVVALLPGGVEHDVGAATERHGRDLLANLPVVPVRAGTVEPVLSLVHQVGLARSTVETGIGPRATGELHRTVLATVGRRTVTEVARSLVHARAVFARTVSLTLINVHLTMHPLKAGFTLTHVAPHLVRTGAPAARVGLTLIDVDLTVGSCGPRYTETLVTFGTGIVERLRENLRQARQVGSLIQGDIRML